MLCHVDAAYNLARWLLGDDHDAEDAVQEANLRALKAYGGLRGDAKPWYLAIVRNASMNLIRARKRRQEMESDSEEVAMTGDRTFDPAKMTEISFDAERLRIAMDALPPEWREMIVLRELEQMSYREMSQVAGVPIGTVMSRLSRARSRLLAVLAEVPE